ncbi:MAG: class I SAM-dependent RNA methyltransferase [Clostridia bacterium]|nr:class I SAM-dependent RNA methyltransferase [Clostridia bacterium]
MANFYDFPDKFLVTVTCASGVEKVLKTELERQGIENVPALNGALTFLGGKEEIAKCNLNLRTADRVYIKVAEFTALDFDTLFEGVKKAEWEHFIPSDGKVTVNGKCVKSQLFATSACQSIIKKAVSDRLGQKYNLKYLPENGADYGIEFSIFKDTVSLYLNTSGKGLHKRGYRDMVGIAPIKETLASALVLFSDFYKTRPFADPFCGSGTIAIEACKIAMNIAGGKGRNFAFNDWKNFDKKVFERAYEQALDLEQRDVPLEFFASDIDPKAVKLAKRHAERAGVADKIRFSVSDVKYFRSDLKNGTIVTNPPYGERVYDMKEAEACYKSLGEVYKNLDGWSAFVITSAKAFERYFGLRADRQRKLYNSNRECRYYYYYGKRRENND